MTKRASGSLLGGIAMVMLVRSLNGSKPILSRYFWAWASPGSWLLIISLSCSSLSLLALSNSEPRICLTLLEPTISVSGGKYLGSGACRAAATARGANAPAPSPAPPKRNISDSSKKGVFPEPQQGSLHEPEAPARESRKVKPSLVPRQGGVGFKAARDGVAAIRCAKETRFLEGNEARSVNAPSPWGRFCTKVSRMFRRQVDLRARAVGRRIVRWMRHQRFARRYLRVEICASRTEVFRPLPQTVSFSRQVT